MSSYNNVDSIDDEMDVPMGRMAEWSAEIEQDADLSTLGGRLAWARSRRGLTQDALGKVLGKSRTTVAQYELGNILPPIDVLQALGKALDEDPSFLAFGHQPLPRTAPYDDNRAIPLEGDGTEPSWLTLPQGMIAVLGARRATLAVRRLDLAAPAFLIDAGAYLLIDTGQQSIEPDGRYYAVATTAGSSVVQSEALLLEQDAGPLRLRTAQGTMYSAEAVQCYGRVLATISRL